MKNCCCFFVCFCFLEHLSISAYFTVWLLCIHSSAVVYHMVFCCVSHTLAVVVELLIKAAVFMLLQICL